MKTMRNAIAVLSTLLLISGCSIAIPESIKTVVNERGAHATRAIKTPLGTYFTSISYVPGRLESLPSRIWRSVDCSVDGVRGRVSYTQDTDQKVAAGTCNAMLDAVDYMAFAGAVQADAEYHAVIVPHGEGIEISAKSLVPFTKLKVQFAFADSPRLRHSVVAIFAHEYLHIVLELTRKNHVVTANEEELGYMAGLCAQLEVLGSISLEDLPGTPIAGVSQAISRSSGEGFQVRRYALQHFKGDTLIATSPSGRQMLNDCEVRLIQFVERTP